LTTTALLGQGTDPGGADKVSKLANRDLGLVNFKVRDGLHGARVQHRRQQAQQRNSCKFHKNIPVAHYLYGFMYSYLIANFHLTAVRYFAVAASKNVDILDRGYRPLTPTR
jgi:hypothetical protein